MNTVYLNGLQIENVKDSEKTVEIEGFICHFNKANLNNEIVDKNSFNNFFSLYRNKQLRPRLNYEHTDQIIGGIDEIEQFDEGLYMRAHLAKNVAIVRDTILPLIETNDLTSCSTEGFVDFNDIIENNDGTYYVSNFMLTGCSIVSCPADPQAKFSLSNFIKDYIAQKEEQQKQIEQNSKTSEEIKSKYYLFM